MLKGELEDVASHQSWILLECCHRLRPLLPGKGETIFLVLQGRFGEEFGIGNVRHIRSETFSI